MAKKILVVDDEDSIRQLLTALLEENGYSVDTAEDGKEALLKIKESKPDLVLLDMMMPGMSGREVCDKVRSNPNTKNLKVAFLTVAKFSEMGKEALEKMKVLDYITKPFDNDDLIRRIKKMTG